MTLDEVLARCTEVDGCWIWGGSRARGYGKVTIDGRTVLLHRLTYELVVGPIPDGLVIDHLCRVRACCNPAHLEPVTQRENLMRGDTLPARNAAKTHCVNGHEYTPENTYRSPSTAARQCRSCLRESSRRFEAKKLPHRRASRRLKPGPCAVAGCDRAKFARGWCQPHYRHWQRHGDPVLVPLWCVCPEPDANPSRDFGMCQRCKRKPLALMAVAS